MSPRFSHDYTEEDVPASNWAVADEYYNVEYVFRRATEADVESATRFGLSSLRGIFVPLAATLALAGGAPAVDTRRRCRYRASSATHLVDPRWHLDEEAWMPTVEFVANEQVRALNELLALPFVPRDTSHVLADE